ncbi:sprouty-related, EVH1 domain-containing protein 2-like [Liolophura sinensis]|uniref:sprouty-related, EVH1 domain-containing protein 2-like n=1 Tax=Liolophura sinensis TaxID=3198878 RepID=UPI003159484E
MTEDSSLQDDDLYLVQVRAQVMTRDDSTGGWVPMEGGGLSLVGLKKLLLTTTGSESDTRSEYLIFGQRIADDSVVLDCVLKKDIQYTQANPTFHHWRTDDKRYGLTFERSSDAKAFDRGIKRAVADLVEGSPESSTNPDVGDDEVFMTIDLPLGRKGSSQSASTTSTTTSSPTPQSPVSGLPIHSGPDFCSQFTHPHANHHHLHRVHYLPKPPHHRPVTPPSEKSSPSKVDSLDTSSSGKEDVWVRADDPTALSGKSEQALLDSCLDTCNVEITNSYVTFEKNKSVPHEYSYPNLESFPKPPTKRDSISSVKKHTFNTQPQLPTKGKKTKDKRKSQSGRPLVARARCQHCHDWYSPEENYRGACGDAPDNVSKCIEKGTCLFCARGLLYHCMSDADGDYGKLCVCDTSDNSNCKKWTALTILSLFVPCLWCYWPLTACHSCAVACECCGSRHKTA